MLTFTKRKKLTQSIVLSSIVLVFYYLLNYDNDGFEYLSLTQDDLNKISLNEKEAFKNVSFSSVDYCENSQDWEILDDDIFFKRDASYYFNDQEYLLLHLITNKHGSFNLKFLVSVLFNQTKIAKVLIKNFKFYKYEVFGNDGSCNLFEVKSFFKLNSILEKFNILSEIDKINLKVKIKYNSQITKVPIKLKIKNLKSKQISKSQHSMICSKIYELKDDDYKIMKWWFEMNKKIGFSKIVIYNTSIENSKKFQDLFSSYENFVQVRQMQCFPNFFENKYEKTYLRSLDDLKLKAELRWLYEVLIFNECYLDHVDMFQYVSIIDQDELIIPRILNDFNPIVKSNQILKDTDNILDHNGGYKCDSTQNNFQVYSSSLTRRFNSNKMVSLHFKMGYYLKNSDVRKIFETFEKFIESNSKERHIFVLGEVANFTFQVVNDYQRNYVIYLDKVYKKVSKYLLENDSSLKNIPESYNRLFYIYGNIVKSHQGKTIHNTATSSKVAHHTSYNFDEKLIPYDYGHVSHFRVFYRFNPKPISIMDLVFDLNYFQCYFVDNITILN